MLLSPGTRFVNFGILLILFFLNPIYASENQNVEWKVLNIQGAVTAVVGDSSKVLGLGQVIENPKNIKSEESSIKLLKNTQEWYLFANSELDFVGENPVLKKGKLRLIVNQPTRIKIQSPVAQIELDGLDFFIVYHEDRARLEVYAFDGKVWVKGIYREEEQQLAKNSKGGFQGHLEKEGPAFDQMLQGKKVVRGDLLAVQAIPPTELEQLKKTYYIENQKVIVKVKPKPKPGQICSEPFAKLNECVWRLLGGRCIRERCYASGLWGDSTPLSGKQKNHCTQKVAPCDY